MPLIQFLENIGEGLLHSCISIINLYDIHVVSLYLESKYNLSLSFSIYSLQRSVSHTGLVNLTMLLGWKANSIIGYSHWDSMAVVLWFILSVVIRKM
jgi:hypothetical protein